MRNSDIKIMVACHKADRNIRQDDVFMPIQVGKAVHPELDLGFQCDNTGDNISAKNNSYCELTAHYWFWKNGSKPRFVGLNHYRRYFGFGIFTLPYRSIVNVDEKIIASYNYLPDFDDLFNRYDIILAKPYNTPYSLEVEYCYAHIINDYRILRQVIQEIRGDYLEAFDFVMNHNNKLSPYNMFIMPYRQFDLYSKWLFDILFEVERRIKISQYADQARVFGYMSERLLNVYVRKNSLSPLYIPVIKIDDVPNIPYYKILINYIRNNITARLTYSRK